MTRILIVEDSQTQAMLLKRMLESQGYDVVVVPDGAAALTWLSQQTPHLMLVDWLMPGMNGLELIALVRQQFPKLPSVLITEFGSEEIAAEALQRGAVSYIPKRRLQNDLLRTLDSIFNVANANPRHQKLLECWVGNESRFILDNDVSIVPHLASHLTAGMALMLLCDEATSLRVQLALSEALTNAIYHGNLELSSLQREDDGASWRKLSPQRIHEQPYCNRKVLVHSRLARDKATFVIRDEGPGFDPTTLPDPRIPGHLERINGRGMLLIRSFMDEIQHNAIGNEITLIKRRAG
jgi:CheY-like chemotaxis protein